jgi:aryl carrier-like protein
MKKILAFHLSNAELQKLKQICCFQNICCEAVAPTDYLQSLKALADNKKSPLASPFTGEIPPESLLLLCGFEDISLDQLLSSLRTNQIQVDYKAVLTPTNGTWNFMRLLLEMRAEKAAYAAKSPSQP